MLYTRKAATAALSHLILAGALSLAACTGTEPGNGEVSWPNARPTGPSAQEPTVPGEPVAPTTPQEMAAEFSEIKEQIQAVQSMDAQTFLTRHDTQPASAVQYTSADSLNYPLLQNSALSLNAGEEQVLDAKGFVISGRHRFPSFLYGYSSIYSDNLPLYVSSDSVMHAVHSSYDEILKTLEVSALVPELGKLLDGMRANISDGALSAFPEDVRKDADVFLSVGLSLLEGVSRDPVLGQGGTDVQALLAGALAADGSANIEIFGASRKVDFSQFKPRGHYTDSKELEQYFRSMVWFGRIDFRMLETQPDHSQVFHRRQFDGALALSTLLDQNLRDRFHRIDEVIRAFVGESDNMTVEEFPALLSDLGAESADGMNEVSDEKIAAAIVDGRFGTQQISGHIMINGTGEDTLPLSSTFMLFGQRYVLDSHVFSNVTFDRVNHEGFDRRMLPNPLDVAFGALGNDQAAALLAPDLQRYGVAPDLESMRILADAHGGDFWGKNLYNGWMHALRALSTQAGNAAAQEGLPALAKTEAWGRRLLNTQLASWSELRHDTILYAKQSYSAGASCEFPDAYVDPYPEFFARVAQWALDGRAVVELNEALLPEWTRDRMLNYFDQLYLSADMLREMAQHERDGRPFTDTHMAFINEAVTLLHGCGAVEGAEGWFAKLYYNVHEAVEFDPTIADVHTAPTDASGMEVGNVLHVGTGMPRLMIANIESCEGVRTYVGLASSYFEEVTTGYKRYDDNDWSKRLTGADAIQETQVSWMSDLVVQ